MKRFLSQPSPSSLRNSSTERTPVLNRLSTFMATTSLSLLYAVGAIAQAPAVTPAINLTSTANSVAAGTPITLTVTVPANGNNLHTGIVRICDLAVSSHCMHENKIGNAALTAAGTATFKFIPGPGVHNYVAMFLQQWHYNTVTSAPTPVSVTPPAGTSTTSVTQSGTTGNYSLTAKIAASGVAGVLPTGSVQFLDTSSNNLLLGTAPLASSAAGLAFSAATIATGTVSGSSSVAVGDFNKDGKMDMAVVGADSTSIQILFGNGDGTFTQGPTVGAFYQGIVQIKTADLNGDGNLDLAAVDLNNSVVHIFLGKGDGTFSQTADAIGQAGANAVTITDYNKDGIPDMIVANRYSGTVSFLAGKGDGTFTSGWASYVSEKNPTNLVSGDFNNDGNQDFAVNVLNGQLIAIYMGNGDGTFAAPVYYNTGMLPTYLAAGDFTGNGIVSLAVANAGDNTVTILAGKGDGTFTTKSTFATPIGLTDILAADFNQDGKMDLVTSSSTGNTLAYFLGNGDGTFTASSVVPAGVGPYQMALGDFNADGVLDVAVADTSNAATAVLTKLSVGSSSAVLNGINIPGTGLHLIVAKYLGDANFAGSTSLSTSLTALSVVTRSVLYTSAFSVTYGKQETLTVNVSPYSNGNNSTNGETVYFYSDGQVIGSAKLQSGSATFDTTSLPVGLHLVGVVYPGDSIFTPTIALNLVNVSSATGGLGFWF